jgi:hypothetical protein
MSDHFPFADPILSCVRAANKRGWRGSIVNAPLLAPAQSCSLCEIVFA